MSRKSFPHHWIALVTAPSLVGLLISNQSFAEYRVFRLEMVDQSGKVYKKFESTLDPLQYSTYYPLEKDRFLQYQETWMCRGRTSDSKEFCKNPNSPASQAPISTENSIQGISPTQTPDQNQQINRAPANSPETTR